MEIFTCLVAASERNLMAAHAANNLFLLYLIAFILNRKAAFIAAFLFTEFYSVTIISDSLTNVNFYLGYALIYCLLYCYLLKESERIRTLAATILIISLDTGMALDAYLYPEVETFFYNSYEFLYVFVHLCLLCSLINWKVLRSIVGEITNAFLGLFRDSYRTTFFWYTAHNFIKQKARKCLQIR